MKNLIFLSLIIFPFFVNAQLSDDFSDGDITNNPTWTGDIASFTVGAPATSGDGAINSDAGHDAFVLSSNANTGDAIITTASTVAYGEWIFGVADGRTWEVSSTNDYKIVLMSDNNTAANLTDGTMDFNGYFLQFDGGSADQFILYKQTGTTTTAVIDTDFPTTADGTTPIARTVKITRTLTGDWSIFIDEGFEITPTTQVGTTVNDNTHTTSSYFGIATNIANPSDTRILYFDNLVITPNNQTSEVSAGATAEPSTISSLIDTDAEKIFVFDFKFTDPASGDALPTIIDQIKITQGSTNEVADWTKAIAGATLSGNDISGELAGAITSSDISFSSDNFISIADGTNETYELKIWLKTNLSEITDNAKLNFKLDFNNIIADVSGSGFGSGIIESGNESIDIQATKINFSIIPTAVVVNSDFIVEVSASDENNNIDTDYTSNTTIAKTSGTGNLTSVSGLSKNMILGKANWTDLRYDAEDIFTISANSGSFSQINSGNILGQSSIIYLNDDFEDNDIFDWQSANLSRWAASDDNALNGTYSLKHIFDNTASDVDKISHPLNSVNLTTGTKAWRFQVNYANNSPSENNNWAIFLMADNDNAEMYPTGNINGYVIGVNFADADDVIKLSEVTAGTATPIITTTFDWNNTTNSQIIGFEVLRTATGDWEIKIDENGGFDALTSYGTANNTTHTTANHFGVYYKYSSTLDRKLTLDDIYFGDIIPDLDAPQLSSVTVISANTLKLIFSEEITTASAENASNYNVSNSIGNPTTATLEADNKTVTLIFGTNFTNNQANNIDISDIEDLSGNTISATSETFTWINIDAIYASATTDNTLDIMFSKKVDLTTATMLSNYLVNSSIGNPELVTIDADNDNLVHLEFVNTFTQEGGYIVSISNVEDIYGNVMASKDLNFIYYKANPYDIVVNEIMCDVNPVPEAIPPYEYIELFNNTDYDLNLTGWTLTLGIHTPKVFPATIIPSNGYLIICDDINVSDFAPYGTTVPILNPLDLTGGSSGNRVVIRNSAGEIIEDLTYWDTWYNDPDKDDGGFSIERIDPTNLCGEEENWEATTDYTGGTPGRQNSVFGSNPDNSKPTVNNVECISSKELKITFSEKLNKDIAENISNYNIGAINPTTATASAETTSIINLVFTNNFNIGENNLEIKNIEDNCGNIIDNYTYTFDYQLLYPKTIEVISENQLRVHFSEKVEVNSAQTNANYFVNGGIGNATIAIINNTDSTTVTLLFDNSFNIEQSYTLTVLNVKDVNNNVMDAKDINFVYYIAKPFDVVINEIMCDINPAPIAVPEAFYIELYNTSDFDIDLTDWEFISEGQTKRKFPYITLKSHEYLILCEVEEANLFSNYENVLPLLASTDIIGSGRNLKLYSSQNTLIEEIYYSTDWYHDEEKDNGGWSLERIDPTNFCGEANNWTACENAYGGTPGIKNSVFASNQDNVAPELLDVQIISSNYLLLEFSENINFANGSDTLNYIVDNNIRNPHIASVDAENKRIVHLHFGTQFTSGQTYSLMVENISDNCDNVIETVSYEYVYNLISPTDLWVKDNKHLKIKFSEGVDLQSGTNVGNFNVNNGVGTPVYIARETDDASVIYLEFENEFSNGENLIITISGVKDVNDNIMESAEMPFSYYTPNRNDIVINELLFHPNSGGSEFVELYNRSDKKIDLINLNFVTWDNDEDIIKSIIDLSETNMYFESKTYLVFAKNKEGVLTFYMSKNSDNIIELSNFPSLDDKSGKVLLLHGDTTVIDEFSYSESMHFQLLDSETGVSLERINFDRPTQDANNWYSASEYVGFATPAYKNSQFSEDIAHAGKDVFVEPYMFSPDNDGIDDFAKISYKFDKPGSVASVTIFDAKGRQVKQIANNLLLSTEGTLIWNGLYDDETLAPRGTYLIYFKVFDLDGNVNVFKIPVVSARRF